MVSTSPAACTDLISREDEPPMLKPTFFARRALLILVVVFFFVPFALRGARMAVQGMKNDVKDWLPKDFVETAELDWFRKHFVSEQFVVVSWDGCTGDAADERYRMFVAKLMPETAPSALLKNDGDEKQNPIQSPESTQDNQTPAADSDEPIDPPADLTRVAVESTIRLVSADTPADEDVSADPRTSDKASESAEDVVPSPTRYLHHADSIGDFYGLYCRETDHYNWGGQEEKWLKGLKRETGDSNVEAWFYIVPNGDLYRWEGVDAPVASLAREMKRRYSGPALEGTLVHSFGPIDGPWYYANPRRLRAQLFKSITTGPDVLKSLIGQGGELESDPEEAVRRLTGTLLGPDGKQTCVVLTLTDAAKRNLHLVIGRGVLGKPRGQLYQVAEESNISESQLRLGGPPVDNVAIDEEGSITLFRLIGLCGLLGIVLSLICFRSISATIMVFFVGGISAVISLAFVWWADSSVDAILMSMPALVYVLALAESSHLMNYYREEVDNNGLIGAPERAIKHAWWPALLCNVTTSIGLLSLYTSELTPIRKFGIFSAIGVTVTLGVLFLYMPAALQIWPQKPRKKVASDADKPFLDRYLGGFLQSCGAFMVEHHAAVSIACILVIAFIGYGALNIKTSVNMLRMFHKDAKIIRDYEWLEANLGELVPMEMVVRVDKRAQLPSSAERADQDSVDPESQFQLTFLERMELASRVQKVVEQEFGPQGQKRIGSAMSAASFVRALPDARGDTKTMLVRGSTNSRMEAHREQFLHSDYLRIDDDDAELWRVSVRVPATRFGGEGESTSSIDYGSFIHELKAAVEPVLAAQRERESILRELVAHRDGKRPAGAKVLLLGVPDSAVGGKKDGESSDSAVAAASDKKTVAEQPAIDQAKIFSLTLADVLNISRLKVKLATGDDSRGADFDKLLASQDCIVLVGGGEELNLASLKQSGKLVIDARESVTAAPRPPVPGVARAATEIIPTVAAVYTGVVPIVYKAQRTLLESLIESTFWSFITILPLMMFISRSFWGGALSMLPNVLPVLVVFGGMGWLKIEVDVGSMMTASIALGIAVDDTIHYLHWFREELDRLGDRKKAILAAYKHCATPTLQAAIMSGLGLSVFALSTFTPTQRFGYLMLAILWAGVAAELIFFPALLAGPLGGVFKPRKRKAAEEIAETQTTMESVSAISTEPPLVESLPGSGVPAPNMISSMGKIKARRAVREDQSHR
jgi:predicted RND superfamily exporter protein